MEMLLKPTVWLDAANQVFYSFGLAFGSIISFGSYNNPEKNCVKDVILISICNGFTAIYACAVIFSILGFKAVHLFEKCMEQWVLSHRNKTRKGQDHWFLPNQSDYSLFAALILLWYWNYNCVLQTNNLSSHWLGQNFISSPFLVTFLWSKWYYWENENTKLPM